MVSTATIVNLQDVARSVTRHISEKSADSTLTPNQVHSVYKCIGNFISFMFKKQGCTQVIADIAHFGTVLRNNTSGKSEFIPSSTLQLETHISKPMPARSESSLR
jgi:hypothetical protein